MLEEEEMSPVDGIYFSVIKANGIRHRLASTFQNLSDHTTILRRRQQEKLPLVLFLHGFPESWYSWRHQLLYFKEKPFVAVALDMRGYGSTNIPQPMEVEDYTQPVLAKDVLGIAHALGYEKFFVVGHDYGCMLAWSVALLYPDQVLGVCGLSIPYAGTPKKGLLTMLEDRYGKCIDRSASSEPLLTRDVLKRAKFHYILHHCLPGCAEEYHRNTREFLYRILAFRPGCPVEDGTPEYDVHGLMFPHADDKDKKDSMTILDAKCAPGLWQRIPRPTSLPPWLSREDLEYYSQEFETSGFHGPLCWYRAADRNYELMKAALGHNDKVLPPSLFLMGRNDALMKFFGGEPQIKSRLNEYLVHQTKQPIFLSDCGHWIQQEQPDIVNKELLEFFAKCNNDDQHPWGQSKL